MFNTSFSKLDTLRKDELECIEIIDEMIPSIKRVIFRNTCMRIFISIFFYLFIQASVVSLIKDPSSIFEMSWVYPGDYIGNIVSIIVAIVFPVVLVWNTLQIFSLRLGNIKYAGYYEFYRRSNVRVSRMGKPREPFLSLSSVYGIDRKSMKRLKRAYGVGGTHVGLYNSGQYLFISSNGKTFYLVPFNRNDDPRYEKIKY